MKKCRQLVVVRECGICLVYPFVEGGLKSPQSYFACEHQAIEFIENGVFALREGAAQWLVDQIVLYFCPRVHEHACNLNLDFGVQVSFLILPELFGFEANKIMRGMIPVELFVILVLSFVREFLGRPQQLEIALNDVINVDRISREIESNSDAG